MSKLFGGTGETFQYQAVDEFGERTLIVPPTEFVHAGDPSPIVLDIEARTRTRLRDGGNPLKFIRAWNHFRERQDPNSGVSFAEFCARRHADWIDVHPAPRRGFDLGRPGTIWREVPPEPDDQTDAGTGQDEGDDGEWYNASWYASATTPSKDEKGYLSVEKLRKAAERGYIKRRKASPDNPKSQNQYEYRSVCRKYPESKAMLDAQKGDKA